MLTYKQANLGFKNAYNYVKTILLATAQLSLQLDIVLFFFC